MAFRNGHFYSKVFQRGVQPLITAIDNKSHGTYRISVSGNKIYADFDDLFVDYFATKEEATIKQTQPKPQPKTKPLSTDQRRYINVIVSVDRNATKAEIMAEIEKSINNMIR